MDLLEILIMVAKNTLPEELAYIILDKLNPKYREQLPVFIQKAEKYRRNKRSDKDLENLALHMYYSIRRSL